MAFELPYMPLWVVDIDTDRDCRAMTDAEFGRYMRLLFRQWMEGDVPTDARSAIRDAMLDPDAVESVQTLLDLKFNERSGRATRGRNRRCNELREAAITKAETNRRNGAKGGRPKADANPTDNPTDNRTVKRIERHSESESESENLRERRDAKLPGDEACPVVAALEARLGRKSTLSDLQFLTKFDRMLSEDPPDVDGKPADSQHLLIAAIEAMPPDVGIWHRYVAATLDGVKADGIMPPPYGKAGVARKGNAPAKAKAMTIEEMQAKGLT